MIKADILRAGIASLLFWLTLLLVPRVAVSAGTPAGTTINNSASSTYSLVGTAGVLSKTSNTTAFKVEEVLDLSLVWQDATNIVVVPGEVAKPLTFILTNTGNGSEAFGLGVDNFLGGDEFDPAFVEIYLDSDDNGSYDATTDTLYVAGTNDPTLASEESLTLFLLNNIPPNGLNDGDTGKSLLTATAKTGSGTPGTIFTGLGQGSTDALVGLTGAAQGVAGVYQVTTAVVSIVKSAEVIGGPNGPNPVPGATIKYTLTVAVLGSNTARGVVITDPVVAQSTYVGGTLTLNGSSLTDVAGDDGGDFSETTADTVSVILGDMTDATPEQIITFNVTIN